MKITLKINGEEKTFVNDYVRARSFREALRLNESLSEQGKSLSQQFDDMAEFVVKTFNHQFTLDELWDGLSVQEVQNEIKRVFDEVLGAGGFTTLPVKQIPEV